MKKDLEIRLKDVFCSVTYKDRGEDGNNARFDYDIVFQQEVRVEVKENGTRISLTVEGEFENEKFMENIARLYLLTRKKHDL